jgi:aminoglycoside phosphotransferase (APT) family kinase protein
VRGHSNAQMVDPYAVLGALGVGGEVSASPVAGGWDTGLWRVDRRGGLDVGGQSYALRLFRETQGAVCAREVAAMGAAAGAVPVPRVRLRGVWRGRPALLMTWMTGETLGAAVRARPGLAWPLGLAFGATQARLHHAAPLPAGWGAWGATAGPPPAGSPPAGSPPAGSPPGESWIAWAGPEEGALQARLRALPGQKPALLHLDYHPLNVLVERGGVSAVLDWANARPGDPRADVARTLSILRLSPAPSGVPVALVRAVLAVLEAGWRRGYRGVAGGGAAVDDPQAPLFNAWAGAVMLRDLGPKLGRPGIPLGPADFRRMRAWVGTWKERAGLAAGRAED